MASIDTRDEGRDGHLRSPDFFETDTYPTMSYRSTGVRADVCDSLAGAGYSLDASDLNGASIAIGDLAGRQTVVRRVTNASVDRCPESDPHACALYYYTEPGDHISFHFDTSYYKGTRYTVLLGLVERSSSRLVCQLHKDDPARAVRELALATEPGTLVLFHGDKLWHKITPLGEREERVSLTLEYVTDSGMTPVKRFVSNMKDAVAYFGFRSVFGRRRTQRLARPL